MLHCRRITAQTTTELVGSCHIQPSLIPARVLKFSQLHKIGQLHAKQKVVLRSRKWVIEAAVPNGGGALKSDGGDTRDENGKGRQCCRYAVPEVEHGGMEEKEAVKQKKHGMVEIVVAAVATVVLGVGNRVLYKLALVPLKHYPFFLAQLATFG